jgi:hypothetical protein
MLSRFTTVKEEDKGTSCDFHMYFSHFTTDGHFITAPSRKIPRIALRLKMKTKDVQYLKHELSGEGIQCEQIEAKAAPLRANR